jgi:DHA2 family multidrug resistance protein
MEIGTTVVVTGCAQLFSVIVAARASQSVDQRIIIGVGLSLFAFSLYMTSFLTPEWGFGNFLWPQVLRGFSIMLCIVPSVQFALSGFAGPDLRYASGLFNLMRNLGGAIGIAMVNTWLADNTRLHVQRFGEAMGQPHSRAAELVADLTTQISRTSSDSTQALLMAQGELARVVARQALTLAFNDVFRLMAWIFVVALVMAPFCRPPRNAAPVVNDH